MATKYHPQSSRVTPIALAAFLNSELTGDLLQVPGIGPATVDLLSRAVVNIDGGGSSVVINGITSTYGLIGVFLAFKNGPIESDGRTREIGSVEHVERFYVWWCSLGAPPGHRAGVVNAIAEKVNLALPGVYDSSVYPPVIEE